MPPIPNVKITKQDFTTGVAAPSPIGVLAILAASSTGTQNQPAGYASDALAVTNLGYGPLTEYGSYCIQAGQNSVVLDKLNASTAGAYGTIGVAGTGTSTFTGDGTVVPYDDYNVQIVFPTGGTVGVTGITYTYSLDGGLSTSGLQQLGTANNVQIPNSGVKINLGAGTILSGTVVQAYTTRPLANGTDLAAGLTALGNSRLPWEGVLIDCTYTGGSTVGQVDTWLSGLEAKGQFHFAILNTRMKNLPATPPANGANPFLSPATGETESAYATAMGTLTGNDASIRVCVGVDGALYTSSVTGYQQRRGTAMFLAARAMLIPIGEDAAYVGRGPLTGASIGDPNGNPEMHDEDLFPGLDALRLVSLRTFTPPGAQGTFICNPNVISPTGSDYVWLQHVRTMNAACGIAWSILAGQLSIGVGKRAPDPVTGGIYIAEHDAQRIEALVLGAPLKNAMRNQVAAYDFVLSRTDDLSSNASALVHGDVMIQSLAYLKQFQIQAAFVKTIAVPSSGQAPQSGNP